MESDNIQSLWQSQEFVMNKKAIDKAYLDVVESKINNSHKRLLRKLYAEIFAGLSIYIGAGLLLFLRQSGQKEILFALKIMLLTTFYAVPCVLLLYQSISKLRITDYAVPVNTHLSNRVSSLKKSLRIYLFAGLLACLFIIIALLTDNYFLLQPVWLKVCGILYVLLLAALLSPALKYHYGKELKLLQQYLDEFEKV